MNFVSRSPILLVAPTLVLAAGWTAARDMTGSGWNCASRTVEFRRFLDVDPDEMRPSWEARQAGDWNNNYCESDDWREAIDNGWKIISAMTFRTGDQLSFVAECE